MKRLILTLLTIALLATCGKEVRQAPYAGTNQVYLTLSDLRTSLTVDDTWAEEIDFLVRLTAPLADDVSLQVALSGAGNKEVKMVEAPTFQIKRGEVSGCFKLKPNFDQSIDEVRIVEVHLTCTEATLTLPSTPFVITIEPSQKLDLSDRERQLLEVYKDKWGIDILPLLGQVQCDGTIEWAGFKEGDYDYPQLVAPRTVLVQKQIMVVGLSDLATEEQIVLHFKQNALGQTTFMREIWEHLTIYSKAYWNHPDPEIRPPYPQYIRERIGWTEETAHEETFDVQLDNVRLDPKTGVIQFTGPMKEAIKYEGYIYEDMFTDRTIVVPFHFETSVWRRMIEAAKGDPLFREQVEGAEVNIYSLLNNVGIRRDLLAREGIEPTNYITPTAKIDFERHTMSFAYPWYVYNSDRYSVTRITCQPPSKELAKR